MHGQYGIYGQIINIPIEVNTMVKTLQRNIEDDHCFYVHLKKKLIHKSSYVYGLVNKANVKEWLSYLITTPLYMHYNIKIDDAFLNNGNSDSCKPLIDDLSKHIPPEDNVTAQQQTLSWNEDRFLNIAPGENIAPLSLLFDEHAEELSFPTIYGGHF